MGRKIPAKKHRGVKDPLEQQARRLQVLKNKINAPPKDPDEQPVPRSLTELFAFRDVDQTKRQLKQKRPRASASNSVTKKSKNPVAALRKLPGESGRGFSLRINSAIKALHQSAEPLDYPPDLEDDEDVKGSRMAEQRARRERKKRRGGAGAGRAGGEAAGRPGRAQRLALKKKDKRLRAQEAAAAEAAGRPRYEAVEFGAVAAAPPALPAPRRAGASHGAPRPGRRSLLLTSLLAGEGGGGAAGGGGSASGAVPAAERARRERARLAAVAAYRHLKTARRRPDDDKKR